MSQCVTNAGKPERRFSVRINNKGNINATLACLFAGLGFFLCTLFVVFSVFKVEKVTDEFYVELGDKVSTKVTDYIRGRDFTYSFASVDLSEVRNEVGEYKAYLQYFYKTFEYRIVVEDTLPPEVVFETDNYVTEPGNPVYVTSFVKSIKDKSAYKLKYLNINAYDGVAISDDKDTAVFDSCGIYGMILRAEDVYGNYKDYYMSVIVDTPPRIMGMKDYFIAVGESLDLRSGLTVYDEQDGDLTPELNVSVPDYTNIPGEYTVTYSVADSNGITAEDYSTIYVYNPLELQDMVNTGKIDPFSDCVAGIINPFDAGYITYNDCEAAIDRIKNAVVRVHYETTRSRTHGSGYIVKITDQDVIVCTNHHVVGSQNTVYVNLYDGTDVKGTVVDSKVSPDIAFIRIRAKDIKKNLLNTLKTIHFNLDYYEELSLHPEISLGMYCINSDGSVWVEKYGKIVRKTGKLSEYFENYDYPVTEVTVELQHGVSGSAIVDSHGNFICMAAYYWKHDGVTEYYGVSANDILDYYEEVFNERLEYY